MAVVDDEYDLADPAQLRAVLSRIHPSDVAAVDGVDCPKCGTKRRVDLQSIYGVRAPVSSGASLFVSLPVLVRLQCRQCHVIGHALLFSGPSGDDVMFAWPETGGLRTAHTPPAVAYYLDQAARSEYAGARSAATTMYRSALEHLLFEQGYVSGMLNAKIIALEADIAANTARRWATDLHPDFLNVIKDLGNGAIHTNGGDISKQDALDTDALRQLRAVIQELLYVVYEEPKQRATRLSKLQSVASTVK